MYVHVYKHIHRYICNIYMYMYTYIYIYIHIYQSTYLFVHILIYIYTYIYIPYVYNREVTVSTYRACVKNQVVSAAAGMLFATSPLTWSYSTQAEVFALNNAFAAALSYPSNSSSVPQLTFPIYSSTYECFYTYQYQDQYVYIYIHVCI